MTRKRYKFKKRVKNFLIFYFAIAVLFIVNSTFSRFLTTTSGNNNVGVAGFYVKVNGEKISEGKAFSIILSPNANTYNNKMAPDSEGYFEIEIDPTGTDVSLEYEFDFDFSDISNNIKLKKCNSSDNIDIDDSYNIVKGTLNLTNRKFGFKEEDILDMKVCWQWNENGDIINPIIPETDVTITAIIQQKIT